MDADEDEVGLGGDGTLGGTILVKAELNGGGNDRTKLAQSEPYAN